ncbi:MAG: hypothetical protein IPJ73_06395 [Zoogloea sp.]|nr:hypothetical protein [Zoogloea sp.]
MPDLIKPPKAQRLPDIVTVEEAQRLFSATRTLSYRVFYFTVYSLGLRLGRKPGSVPGYPCRIEGDAQCLNVNYLSFMQAP